MTEVKVKGSCKSKISCGDPSAGQTSARGNPYVIPQSRISKQFGVFQFELILLSFCRILLYFLPSDC